MPKTSKSIPKNAELVIPFHWKKAHKVMWLIPLEG
jgi:hypothetical protein